MNTLICRQVWCTFKKILFFLFWIIVFNSCQSTERNLSIPTIEVDATSNAELKLSEYFENFRMLKLPTDTVMGEIKRIRYENNQIYISDGHTMFIFSDTGKLLSSFNKTGRGPDEYIAITDFIVDGENIIILSRTLQKLLTYNHFGECISTYNLGYWAQAISPAVNHFYFLYCGNESGDNNRYKLRSIQDGQPDSLYLLVDRNQAKYLQINSENYFYQHRESIYFFEAFKDTVYESVGGRGIKPSFYIDYMGNNVPASFFERKYANIAEFFQEFHKTSYAYGIFNFATYDRFLMFSSFYQKNMKLTVFDQKNQTSNTFATIKDDVYFNGLSIPVSEFKYHASKSIIVPLDAFGVFEWKNAHPPAEQLKEVVDATKEGDNPLLLIFDFKQ